jgi:hypothetical protein
MYNQMPRSNVASTFPRHVFLRAANLESNLYDRVVDRENCFKSTLVHLTERFHGKDVYLVGTANCSTMLAQRTRKLIEEIEPDTVIVQTSADWWSAVRKLEYVDSQEEMDRYTKRLTRYLSTHESYMWSPSRRWLAGPRWRLYASLWQHFFKFQRRFDLPGLEQKYACEAAERVNAKLHFVGSDLDSNTRKRIAHETRMSLPDYIVRRFQFRASAWIAERNNNYYKMQLAGDKGFTEKCLDQH